MLLISSFLDMVENGDSAWGEFGVYTWPALLGLVVAGGLAAVVFGNVDLPDQILTFSAKQVFVVLALAAAVIQVGVLLSLLFWSPGEGFDAPGPAFGVWLGAIAAIALAVGTVMELQDDAPARGSASSNVPPSPF